MGRQPRRKVQDALQWATPNSVGRTIIDLQGNQSVALPLPFALPLGGRSYTDLRIHADGFVTFPASETDRRRAGPLPAHRKLAKSGRLRLVDRFGAGRGHGDRQHLSYRG